MLEEAYAKTWIQTQRTNKISHISKNRAYNLVHLYKWKLHCDIALDTVDKAGLRNSGFTLCKNS